MANMVLCTLDVKGENTFELVKDLLHEKKLKGRFEEETFPYVLNYGDCDFKTWKNEKDKILKKGVYNCATESRRDYTAEEAEELGYYPLSRENDGKITWVSRYSGNDAPAFFISRKFKDIVFSYSESYSDGDYYEFVVLNGKFKMTQKTNVLLATS